MRGVALVVATTLLAGCAVWPELVRPEARLLDNAERQALEGEYHAALVTYDDLLDRYPDGGVAARARLGRQTVSALLAQRREVERLRVEAAARELELERIRQSVAMRDGDVSKAREEAARLRQEVAALRQELAGLRQELATRQTETERLRTDLEELKKLDLRLERRRP